MMNVLKKNHSTVILSAFRRVILSAAKNLAVLTVAASMFVACGDDSGTGAKDDDSSSSVVEESSSSDKATEPAEESSSSVAEKESSSSSSVTQSSSSDVILSASEESSDAKSSSSTKTQSSSSSKVPEPAEGSSSSAERSSSSSNVPFDHSKYLSKAKYEDGVYKSFVDERTGRSYYYITITGKDTSYKVNTVTVMAENLNIGEMVDQFDDQTDDLKIERYCYKNDTIYCDKYGGLYQWAEMMALPSECNQKSCADQIKPNHQGICPDGWRLLTYNDMYTIVHADGNNHGVEGVRSVPFGGYNTTGYSLVGAGYLWNYRFANVNTITYWYYPEEGIPTRGGVSSTSNTGTGFELSAVDKTNGLSVRCVKLETEE